jgi:hypothetical protein
MKLGFFSLSNYFEVLMFTDESAIGATLPPMKFMPIG